MTAYGTLQEESKRRTGLINNIIGSANNADATAIKQKIKEIETLGSDL